MSRVASPPLLWSQQSAMREWFRPVRYLAENYPECGEIEALDLYHDAVYEAAAREDWDGYVDALRNFIRAERRAALPLEPT